MELRRKAFLDGERALASDAHRLAWRVCRGAYEFAALLALYALAQY